MTSIRAALAAAFAVPYARYEHELGVAIKRSRVVGRWMPCDVARLLRAPKKFGAPPRRIRDEAPSAAGIA